MNADETRAAARVMMAASEGKQIQWCYKGGKTWCNSTKPFGGTLDWDWARYEYRVRPEPIECQIICVDNRPMHIYRDGDEWSLGANARVVRMREVTDTDTD